MPINAAAQRHGHRYDATRVNAPCIKCSDDSNSVVLECRYDDGMPRYWVLQFNDYSNDSKSFTPCNNRSEVASELIDLGYLDNPAVTVFDGTRTPWDEEDPYPDFIVSRGPRGGVNWERA